jgi:hypothetical protein
MNSLPIRRLLDISTDHLSKASEKVLEDGGVGDAILVVTPTEHGYLVFADTDEEKTLSEAGVPQDLVDLLEFATRNGCDYIMFDNDAAVVPGLPTFQK